MIIPEEYKIKKIEFDITNYKGERKKFYIYWHVYLKSILQ